MKPLGSEGLYRIYDETPSSQWELKYVHAWQDACSRTVLLKYVYESFKRNGKARSQQTVREKKKYPEHSLMLVSRNQDGEPVWACCWSLVSDTESFGEQGTWDNCTHSMIINCSQLHLCQMINRSFPFSALIQCLLNRGKRYSTSSQVSMLLEWTNTLKKNKKPWLISFLLILRSQGWAGRKMEIFMMGKGKNYSTAARFQKGRSIHRIVES